MAQHKLMLISVLTTLVVFVFIVILTIAVSASIFDNENTSSPAVPTSISRPSPLPATFIPPTLTTPTVRPTTRSFVGETLPDVFVQDIEGNQLAISEIYTDKIIVLNFWATWCPPCVEEMPALLEFDATSPDDVIVLAITAPNNQQSMSEVTTFVDTHQLSDLTILLDGHLSLHNQLAVLVMPTTFFINKDGVIVKRIAGPLDLTQLDAFVEEARNS